MPRSVPATSGVLVGFRPTRRARGDRDGSAETCTDRMSSASRPARRNRSCRGYRTEFAGPSSASATPGACRPTRRRSGDFRPGGDLADRGGSLGAGRRRRSPLAGVGGGDGRRRAPNGGDVSSRRLLNAHLPMSFPERRETVAGECLGCQTQFAVDVRLPLPAACTGLRSRRTQRADNGGNFRHCDRRTPSATPVTY